MNTFGLRKPLLVLTVLVIALMLASCAQTAPAPAPAPQPTAVPQAQAPKPTQAAQPTEAAQPAAGAFKLNDKIAERMKSGQKPVIRVSYHDVSNEFAPQIKAGVERAATELNVDAVMVGPTGADADKQIAELESLITSGVDGLAISSVSTDALAPILDKALQAGIPVVTFNTDNPRSQRLAFVGQDLVQSGRIAGELMGKALNGKGVVMITTLDAAAQWSLDREKGAREGLAKYPDIKIVTTLNTGTEPNQIYSAIENAMTANPDITGILSLECCSTPAAGDWVSRNGKTGKVTIVGFDLLPKTLQYIKEGVILETIGQGPEKQGYEAVNLVVKALKGEPVQGVDTGAEIVDSSNIDKYLPGGTAPAGAFKLNDKIAERMKSGQKPVIRVSYHDVSNEFAPQIKAGVERAATELNVDAVMVGPTGADADKQIAELESLITSGVDGLAISSVSTDALAPILDKALQAGIPVVTFNTDNPRSQRLAFVGQDLVQSGRIAGELMGKALNGKGVVMITTLDAAAQWSLDREKGAREGLAKYPDIKIVTTLNTGTEPNQIYSAIENAMTANPDITGILSLECCSTPAAGDWVSRNGKTGKVTIVGFDLLPKTLQYIKEGVILETIGQGPEKQGYEAVNLVVKALKGEPVQGVDTGAEIVDSSNIDKYIK